MPAKFLSSTFKAREGRMIPLLNDPDLLRSTLRLANDPTIRSASHTPTYPLLRPLLSSPALCLVTLASGTQKRRRNKGSWILARSLASLSCQPQLALHRHTRDAGSKIWACGKRPPLADRREAAHSQVGELDVEFIQPPPHDQCHLPSSEIYLDGTPPASGPPFSTHTPMVYRGPGASLSHSQDFLFPHRARPGLP